MHFGDDVKSEPVVNFSFNQSMNTFVKTEPVMNLSINTFGGVSSFDRPIQYHASPKQLNLPVSAPILIEDDEPEVKTEPMTTKPSKQFRCGICQYLSPTKDNLEAHWRTDCRLIANPLPEPVYSCGECETKVKTVNEMKEHWKFRCTGFAQKQAMKSMAMSQHTEKLGKQSILNNIAALISNGTISAGRSL